MRVRAQLLQSLNGYLALEDSQADERYVVARLARVRTPGASRWRSDATAIEHRLHRP